MGHGMENVRVIVVVILQDLESHLVEFQGKPTSPARHITGLAGFGTADLNESLVASGEWKLTFLPVGWIPAHASSAYLSEAQSVRVDPTRLDQELA
jgi:hypothetical protein